MTAILADTFVKATVLLLLAALGAFLLRSSSAALRHHVWALACVAVLALPVVSALLPSWRVAPWPTLDAAPAVDVTVSGGSSVDAPGRAATPEPEPLRDPEPAVPRATSSTVNEGSVRFQLNPDWRTWLVPVWLGGVAIVLTLVAIGLVRVAWLGRFTRPVQDESWLVLVEELSRELGLTRHVRVLQAKAPAMPMTWGMRRPAILLPAEADAWPAERRRDVLLHELAHVKRHDFFIQLIARVACAVYWFHPLVWLAATRLREERERACDDHVLRAGATPSEYATHLLEIARGLRAAPATSLASVAMARPAQLATRLIDVLDARRCRDTLSPRSAWPAWIAAIVVVVPLAAVAPRVADPAPAAVWIDTIPRLPSPEIKAKRPSRAAPAPRASRLVSTDTLKGCSGKTNHTSSSTAQENEDLMIFTNLGGCSIRFSSTGKFSFTEDFTDIASVDPDGRVVITVDYGATDRRVTIRAGNQRVYRVDGEDRPFDAEAQRWLTEVLTYLLRRTGFQAEERAQWILNKRGIQGLLDEFGQLHGDYVRRIYYQAAVNSGKLDVEGYERLVGLAAQTISSDYELAELLISISQEQPLTERMQTGFAAAAKSISSDYERSRVLKAALSRRGLSAAVQSSLLDAAADISSDYELATLLIELHRARPIDDAVRPAYFKAANSIQSDYEHRRVLSTVVTRDGMSGAMLAEVLAAAPEISSDYELAELLIEIGTGYALDEKLRPLFFTAANTINSDYELARVLKSVATRDQVTKPVTLALLESAKGISSDHELSELLLVVIRRVPLDEDIRAAIRADAATLSSQYDRGRVYEALARE